MKTIVTTIAGLVLLTVPALAQDAVIVQQGNETQVTTTRTDGQQTTVITSNDGDQITVTVNNQAMAFEPARSEKRTSSLLKTDGIFNEGREK